VSRVNRREQGASILTALCFVITAWMFLTALLRVLPIYLEHRVIVSAMHNVAPGYDSAAHGRGRGSSGISENVDGESDRRRCV
jgi:hypothetical protein